MGVVSYQLDMVPIRSIVPNGSVQVGRNEYWRLGPELWYGTVNWNRIVMMLTWVEQKRDGPEQV